MASLVASCVVVVTTGVASVSFLRDQKKAPQIFEAPLNDIVISLGLTSGAVDDPLALAILERDVIGLTQVEVLVDQLNLVLLCRDAEVDQRRKATGVLAVDVNARDRLGSDRQQRGALGLGLLDDFLFDLLGLAAVFRDSATGVVLFGLFAALA